MQDVSGGKPVPVEGTALPLWGLEIDPDRAKEDFRAFNARDNGKVGSAWLLTHLACSFDGRYLCTKLSFHLNTQDGCTWVVGH